MLWEDNYLTHYGIKGQHWGVRRFQNLDGTLTQEGKERYRSTDTIFVSGSSKTQDPSSEFYRKELPKQIKDELDAGMKANSKFVVGDAPGIDRQVQDYLNSKKYERVEVYGPGTSVRYSANKKWKTHPINDTEHEPGSKEWLAKKDEAMTKAATVGLAVVIEDGASATRKNVSRLIDQSKDVKVFSINGKDKDGWIDEQQIKTQEEGNIKGFNKKKYLAEEQKRYDKNKKRINTFLKVAGGVAVTAAIGYGLYKGHKYIENFKDKDISIAKGKILSRIQVDEKQQMKDHPFYASFKKSDTVQYKSMLSAMRREQGHHDIYLSTAKVKNRMKIAGDSTGEKVFNSLFKDNSEFRDGINKINESPFKVTPVHAKTPYEIFNSNELVGPPKPRNARLREIFYSELKKKGYDGLIDNNDKAGLYKTKAPVIIFNSEKLADNNISKFSNKQIDDAVKELKQIKRRESKIEKVMSASKNIAITSSAFTGMGLISKISINVIHNKREAIAEYRQEHPNTKLSDYEIYDVVSRNK